jgi:hypothetical protein
MAKTQATVARYGDETGVRLVTATIHKGEQILDNVVFRCEDYVSAEEMMATVMLSLFRQGFREIRKHPDVLPMVDAYCSCCGEIVSRIS